MLSPGRFPFFYFETARGRHGLHQPRRPPAAGHRQRPFVRTTPVAAPDHVPVPHPDLDQAMVMVARQGQQTVARVLFINTRVLHSTYFAPARIPICPTPHTAKPHSKRVWLFTLRPRPGCHQSLPCPSPPKGRQSHQMAQRAGTGKRADGKGQSEGQRPYPKGPQRRRRCMAKGKGLVPGLCPHRHLHD